MILVRFLINGETEAFNEVFLVIGLSGNFFVLWLENLIQMTKKL